MTYKGLINVLAVLLMWGLSPAHADPLIIYTENYPPYNLLDDDGEVVGLATEKVRQVMASSGLEYEIRLVPWSRAVHYTQNNANALIYSITRTPARESQFDWLVPLAESSFYVFNREKDIRVIDLESIRAGAYTGACVSNDLGCELFRVIGMPNHKILRVADNETADFRMVVAERADLYISDINVNTRLRLSEGFDPMLTKPVLRLEGKTGFYLAGGAKLDPDIRSGIVKAYEALMRANAYQLADPQKLQSRLSR
ncbi:MAG: transporter substrate-binding domain-containing protein [Kordiimonadaceae bacterium]|nr:transporter substrate-binding domain-containing protein [Kordiimonadaceae bacterium]MBO6567768.1 transporter substrate-binding domain-containing protein [Kordiimonadaceae bacterium]MBO6963017.1 transporter substrate-binding domain-containing protein [Kordiimonadaceae bacterium]